ncbi:hypothetical protein M8J76_012693 [Diaphorina citri]|nr:hypothetical protein M8J76_012693 [Diaphorina citri]
MIKQIKNIPAHYVSKILNASVEGRDLLKRYNPTKPLPDSDKRLVARVIILSILSENPKISLGGEHYAVLAKQIVEVFPTENETLYYTIKVSAKDKLAPSKAVLGKLYDAYVTRKRILKESNVITKRRRSTPSAKSSTSGCSLPEDEEDSIFVAANEGFGSSEDIHWLRSGTTPWEVVVKKWADTSELRTSTLQSATSQVDLNQYLNLFPVLKLPLGLEYEHHSGKTNQLQSVCTMQVVPLRDVLVQFFSLKNVLVDTIAFLRSLANSDNPIENITQGSVWLNMKDQFDIQQDAIFYMPLIVYYDDFETNNPLGSHNVIQKLGGIYVSLPCLPKKYSSLLSNILLFGLFHASDRLTFGNNVVFHNIIEQLNDLQENGIKVKYCEFDVVLKFKVVCLTGDNLGLNGILGFVENFNAAYCCRICYANKEERQTNFYENAKLLRTKNKYLEDLHLKEDVATKGIKEPCAWLALKGFDPFEHVSVDALHDAFEGCCRYVMTFVASYLLENSLVKIEVLQNRLQSFDYGPDNSSRPVNAISSVSSSKALIRTSASEMITLMRYFPLIIGDHVPRGNDV